MRMAFSCYYNREIFEHIQCEKEQRLLTNICNMDETQINLCEEDFRDEGFLNPNFRGSRTERLVQKIIVLRRRQLRGNVPKSQAPADWFQVLSSIVLQVYVGQLVAQQFSRMMGVGWSDDKK